MTLEVREAVLLGQVFVARLAADIDVHALAIKGPALTVQGLRDGHQSSDVDVLVDPSQRDRFLVALEALGWSAAVQSTAPRILPQHARTLRHVVWPVEIDVHDRFPGFLAEPQAVFAALWGRRTTVQLAGVDLPTCDPVGHAAIMALHHLRDPGRRSSNAALSDLSAILPSAVGPEGLADLVRLAEETQSTATLAPFLRQVGAPTSTTPPGPDRGDGLADWRLRTEAVGPVSWGVAFARQPMRRWPGILWHAIWLSDEEIDAFHRQGDEAASTTALRIRRLRRGVRQLPTVARELARARGGAGR